MFNYKIYGWGIPILVCLFVVCFVFGVFCVFFKQGRDSIKVVLKLST